MIFEENYIYAGKILKAHGYKGEFLVFLEGLGKVNLNKMGYVFLEIDGIQVPFFIEDITSHSHNKFVLKLEEINSDTDAEDYIGNNLCITPKFEKKVEIVSGDHIIIGYKLKDLASGKEGEILEIVEIPGNNLIRIVLLNKKEALVPFNNDLVVNINDKERIVEMNLPEGLI